MRAMLPVAMLSVLGCVSPSHEAPQGEVLSEIAGEDEEPNGRYVLGAVLDAAPYTLDTATSYFNMSSTGTRGKVTQSVSITGGATLKSVGADGTFSGLDPRFAGLALPSSDGRFTVLPTAVRAEGSVTFYRLDIRDTAGVTTTVCAEAVPLLGTVTRSGEHVATPGRLTLACVDGSAGKCARWRYAPGASATSPLWGAHQACMQGVNANYCANGASSTRVGTMISFMDNVGINQVAPGQQYKTLSLAEWPPNTVDYYFETAFPAGHQEATCIGKLRWPAITATCVATLPDCTEATIDEMIAYNGSVMFFASKYNQLRLERWRSGADLVATVRGYHHDDQQKVPWTGYEYAGVDAILLRVPPLSVPLTSLWEVSLYERNGGADRVLARSTDTRFANAQWTKSWEGYVYKQPSGSLIPLRLFYNPGTGDYTSTTETDAAMAQSGYVPVTTGGVIGWVAPWL